MTYVQEKLYTAMRALATSPATIQDRLVSAYLSGLMALKAEDFEDAGDRAAFDQIMAALTSTEATGDEGQVRASAQRMSDDEAAEVARQIAELHDRVFPR